MSQKLGLATVTNGLADFIAKLLGAALMLAVVLNFTNVIARYGFNHSLTGIEEFEIYLMIGMAFIGGLVAHIRRRHLRMDVMTRYFPPLIARLVSLTESLLTIAVCGLMTWVSWNYTIRIFQIDSHSPNAGIPMWIPHSALAVAFSLICLVELARLLGQPSESQLAPRSDVEHNAAEGQAL
jgi:TRAP-type C4-dicarboxylate transport system permease small subunit